MARPIKNSCDYFPHDAGMRNHPKIKAIRNKFTHGFAMWVMTLELLTSSDGNVIEFTDLSIELISADFGIDSNEYKLFLEFCIKIEILFNNNGFINSTSLDERLAPVYQKRGKAKEDSAKQKRINGKYVSATEITVQPVVSVTETPHVSELMPSETPQSKVKKSKEYIIANAITQKKDIFKNEIAEFVETFGADMCNRFYNYWTELNQSKTKMKFQLEKTFEVSKRLHTWSINDNKFYKSYATK